MQERTDASPPPSPPRPPFIVSDGCRWRFKHSQLPKAKRLSWHCCAGWRDWGWGGGRVLYSQPLVCILVAFLLPPPAPTSHPSLVTSPLPTPHPAAKLRGSLSCVFSPNPSSQADQWSFWVFDKGKNSGAHWSAVPKGAPPTNKWILSGLILPHVTGTLVERGVQTIAFTLRCACSGLCC